MSVPELIAHRGHRRVCPENTLAAVRSAIEAGARNVEIDVQLSADRVPFLFHDRSLERVCGVEGPVEARSAAELAELRATERERFGERFADEPLATLEGFVHTLSASPDVHAFVEIKRAALEAFGADVVLDAVLPHLDALTGRCTLISFDTEVLRAARARCEHPAGPVLDAWDDRTAEAVTSLEPNVVFCNVMRLPFEGDLDVPGGRLAVYEINTAALARDLYLRGVALIETFAIGAMLAALAEEA